MNDPRRIISLIKKTRRQPVIFHMLHSHLASILQTKKALCVETLDLWEKVLMASVEDCRIPRNPLETKIYQYLKGSRQKTETDTFRLRIILYYMDSRPVQSLNMFIMFELMTNHYGASLLTDAIIDSMLTRIFLSRSFGVKSTKRLANDAVLHFLGTNRTFSHKRLPVYAYFDVEPPLVAYAEESELVLFKTLEALSIYANYTKNIEYFKRIIPQTQEFLDAFRNFVCRSEQLFPDTAVKLDLKRLGPTWENDAEELKSRIEVAFRASKNKLEFKASILEFLNVLSAE